MSTEKERETHVYMAKLAEQAERYDGNSISRFFTVSCGQGIVFFFFLDSWIDFRKINYTACRHLSFMMQIDHFIFI